MFVNLEASFISFGSWDSWYLLCLAVTRSSITHGNVSLSLHTFFKVRTRLAAPLMFKTVARISFMWSVTRGGEARGIYSPRPFVSSRGALQLAPYNTPAPPSQVNVLTLFFHLIFFVRNLRMPRWDDITSCTLGYRDIYNGQGMFTERMINAKENVWEAKSRTFLFSLW